MDQLPVACSLTPGALEVLGNGVIRYIVEPITSGAASGPATMPVEKVQATFRRATLEVLISSSRLNRVLA